MFSPAPNEYYWSDRIGQGRAAIPFFRHFSKESVSVSLRSSRKSKSILEEKASRRFSRATCRVLALEKTETVLGKQGSALGV